MSYWTEDEEEQLKSSIRAGKSFAQAADDLDRTIDSVRIKYQRLCAELAEDVSAECSVPTNLTDEYLEALTPFRQKELLLALKRESKRRVKQETNYVRLVEDVRANIKALPTSNKIKLLPKSKGTEAEEAVLLLSDIHLGEVVSKEQMSGNNEYNFAIAEERLNNLVNISSDLLLHKLSGYKFRCLHIALLGDTVSGSIHDELRDNLEFDEPVLLVKATQLLARVIAEFSKIVPEVKVYCFIGNHGRTTQKETFKDKATNNVEYTVYGHLPEYLKNYKNVTVHQSQSVYEVITVNGHRIFMTHGDLFNSVNPKVIQETLNKHQQQTPFDSAVAGHFHTSSSIDYGKGMIFLNGSVVGSNEYSSLKMGAFAKPKQWLFGVCPERITWQYVVECDHKADR